MKYKFIGANENPFHGKSKWMSKHRIGGGIWYQCAACISATEYKHVGVVYFEYDI